MKKILDPYSNKLFKFKYEEHITSIKYWLIFINLFLMIIAIKAVVNYQNIVNSIDEVKRNIENTREHTDYINNFLTPYLNSEYAPYFLAHENNQLLPWETIVKITVLESDSMLSWWTETTLSWTTTKRFTPPTPGQSWQRFIQSLTDDIVWKRR